MILYPAIDISEGKAVRLVQGDFEAKTVYNADPFEAAKAWVQEGARFLHVIDLDGARTGTPQNIHHLEKIAGELEVPVQYGGGLRSLPAVRDALRAGAERVILGTAAFTDIDFLDDVLGCGEYGAPFVSAVARGEIYGVQFHPEKSSAAGLRLLANFTAICARTPA